MDRSEILVTINPGSEWSAPIDRSFFSIARRLGGLNVWVSTSLLPVNGLLLSRIQHEIAHGNVAARWLSFDPSQNDSRNKVRSDKIYILYWNQQHASVGELVGHNFAAESDEQAKAWANIELENREIHLIFWSSVSGTAGWHTVDALSGQQYLLQPHLNRWTLIRAISNQNSRGFEDENDASSWATDVVRFQRDEGEMNWKAGPDARHAQTMYSKPGKAAEESGHHR